MTQPDSRVEYCTHPVTNPADPLSITLANLLNGLAAQGWRYVGTADGQHIFEHPRQAASNDTMPLPRER
jgi:hypothetical protein